MSDKPVNESILSVNDLTITYDTEKGPLDTVRNVSFDIKPGEIFGLVGESGSGKTTLALAIARYLAANGRISNGSVHLSGIDLSSYSKSDMRRIWGTKIAMVHQDPTASINPSMRIGDQITEIAQTHLNMSGKEAREKALEMLHKVRMPDPKSVAKRYAHQLSGGMLQRILIATALTTNPELLIMDEPTTALDVTTEAVILDLIGDLLKESNSAILYITHNLGVVARVCHRVGVLYAGQLMEEGDVHHVLKDRLHPYTRGLLGSIPRINTSKYDGHLTSIKGFIPRPDALPPGCIFAPRCPYADDKCALEHPPLIEIKKGHFSACRLWETLIGEEEPVKPGSGVGLEAYKQLILETKGIRKSYDPPGSFSSMLKSDKRRVQAVDDVSVRVYAGFTMGIVGESGCGKTSFARCIAGLEKADEGEIILNGNKLPYSVSKRSPDLLKDIQMVFQNPTASLNPHHTIGQSISRPLKVLKNLSGKNNQNEVSRLLNSVNLPEDYANRLPNELSGGEKQRVAIARALTVEPALIICDEPISALDVSVQASLINLLADLQQDKEISYLFISHDLAAIRHISDWILVIYLGRIWEEGSAEDIFNPPYHPYTEALLSAIPIPDPDVVQEQIRLSGNVPSALQIPSGCRFHTRCPRMIGDICKQEEPEWQSNGFHHIRCHIPMEELSKTQHKFEYKSSTGSGKGVG